MRISAPTYTTVTVLLWHRTEETELTYGDHIVSSEFYLGKSNNKYSKYQHFATNRCERNPVVNFPETDFSYIAATLIQSPFT